VPAVRQPGKLHLPGIAARRADHHHRRRRQYRRRDRGRHRAGGLAGDAALRRPVPAADIRHRPRHRHRAAPGRSRLAPLQPRLHHSKGPEPMALALENVSKHFGSLVAIRSLSLSFDVGSIYSIIGPNGAGKSTVVNMIAGSYSVTSGTIRLGATALNRLPKHRIAQLGVSRTYQNLRLFDGMTVLENLEVCFFPQSWLTFLTGAKRLSKAERLEICHACLAEFHLSDVADVLAGDL